MKHYFFNAVKTHRLWFGHHLRGTALLVGLMLSMSADTSHAEDRLLAWGYNDYGMINVPSLPSGVTFTDVSAGIRFYSLGVTSQGEGIGWGYNGWGSLNFPSLPSGVTYTKVAAGYHHSLALRSDGQVEAFGYNSGNGELDVAALPAGMVYTQVAAGYLWSAALRSDGNIIVWGYNGWNQHSVPALPAGVVYTQISANYHYGLGVRSDGQIAGFGYDGWGSLDVPSLPSGVTYTKVSAGYHHTMALRSDGQVVAFGYDSGSGELSVPSLPPGKTYTDIAAGYLWGMAVRSDGNLIGWGNNSWGNLDIRALPAGSIYKKAFAGQIHGLAIKHDYVTLTINGGNEMSILLGGVFNDPGATAHDDSGNSLSVTTTGTVNVNALGTYYLTYTATDSAGHVASAQLAVNVVKKLPSDLWGAMMPSYAQNPAYANVTANDSTSPITVWGRAWNGTPPYSFDLDFGDGTPHYTGTDISAEAAKFIGQTHVYTSSGTKTAQLTVSDSAGRTITREAKIRVLVSTTYEDRVNMAIEKGLLYLYNNQTVLDANRNYWNVYGWNHQLASGPSGAAVLAFEENGHLPGNDYEEDIYAETVRKGLNHILDYGIGGRMTIPAHSDGIAVRNSDWNGNGTGAYISDETYANTFGGLAIVLSQRNAAAAQSIIVKSGPFAGMTYYELIQDVVEQYAWAQGDDGNRGAMHYYPKNQNNGFDGSTMNWPPLLIKAAQDRWQIQPEPWYIENAQHGFRYLQDGSGGIGYGGPGQWVNIHKSGGILVAYSLSGIGAGQDVNVDRAITFIGNNWNNSRDPGWAGDFYAMYGMKKGLSVSGVKTINASTGPRDWYQDYCGWLLGDASLLDLPGNSLGLGGYRNYDSGYGQDWNSGSWGNNGWISPGGGFATAHAVLILTKSVTVALPIPRIAAIPDQSSRRPANFTLDGSASSHADSSLSIVRYAWDWDASNGVDWDHPDAVGQTVSVRPNFPENFPGQWTPGSYTVTLRVTDNNDPANSAIATATVLVSDTDVAPIAKPIPAAQQPPVYAGRLGDDLLIDGRDSYDPDGDVISGWAWDLDGNGTYGDADDATLDTTGNADGPTATVTFTTEYNGTIGLQVTANGKTGKNSSAVNIFASPSDLYVASITAANVVQGTSADITVVLNSAVDSGRGFTGVNVRFFNGNPFATGTQIGGNYLVDLPVGGSATVLATGMPMSPGQEAVFVYVDATSSVDEYNETNNTASVNVANQPPTAAVGALPAASIACNNPLTIAVELSDPNNDPLTVVCTVDGVETETHQLPAGTLRDSITKTFGFGSHTVQFSVTDGKSPPVTTSTRFTIEDIENPVLTCPAGIRQDTDAGQCEAKVSIATPTATDNCTATVTGVRSDGLALDAAYPVGVTTIRWTATDAALNSVDCRLTVTVSDNEKPKITCPMDITTDTGAGMCLASVTVGMATATDNCAATVTGVRSDGLAMDSSYPSGVTTIKWTATDAALNSVDCTQAITVNDKERPQITCPTDIAAETGAGLCLAPITVGMATATDNCAATVTGVRSDGLALNASYPIGVTTIQWSARDTALNSVDCTQTITVSDKERPQITCPRDITTDTDPRVCGANVTLSMATATDNCAATVMGVRSDGLALDASYPSGVTTIQWTATDAALNSVDCTQTITVKDNEKPVITTGTMVIVSDRAACDAEDHDDDHWKHHHHKGRHRDEKEDHSRCKENHRDGDRGGHGYICKHWIRCRATEVVLTEPVVADNCSIASVINDHPSASYPLGETLVTWTVTDTSGNTNTAVQKVIVVASVEVEFDAPVVRKPTKNNIKRGQVIPFKVELENCLTQRVKSGVTVKLQIQGIDASTGDIFEDVMEDATGVGTDGTLTSNGLMQLREHKWQFNLDTSNFGDPNTIAGNRFYRATVTVIDNATLAVVGLGNVNLETGKK